MVASIESADLPALVVAYMHTYFILVSVFGAVRIRYVRTGHIILICEMHHAPRTPYGVLLCNAIISS